MRFFFFFQAEDGIRDLVRSRGLGDVYKRQAFQRAAGCQRMPAPAQCQRRFRDRKARDGTQADFCLLYTSDAADERSSVNLGGCRIL